VFQEFPLKVFFVDDLGIRWLFLVNEARGENSTKCRNSFRGYVLGGLWSFNFEISVLGGGKTNEELGENP
jgi:hypothetical protein